MKQDIERIVRKLRVLWKYYLIQSFLATLAVFIVFLILTKQEAVIIASIGATAFIVFAMPKSVTAQPKNIIGGYLVGTISGVVFALIPKDLFLLPSAGYALAVGLSIFIMVVIDTEHPPASGIALGVALRGISLEIITVAMMGAIILALFHHWFKGYLKDLV